MARILVVDDDDDIRTLVQTRLNRLGHRVLTAASGEEALALLAEKGAPEVLVLDVLMAGMSGLELLGTIRQDPALADVPAVFLSGRVLETDIEAGRALGATYLTKPVVLSALAATIDKLLDAGAVTAGTW